MFLRVQWPSKPQLKVNYKPGKVLAGNNSTVGNLGTSLHQNMYLVNHLTINDFLMWFSTSIVHDKSII